MSLAIVMAVGKDAYVPVSVHHQREWPHECYTKPLVVDDNDDPYRFMSFDEANRVIRSYVDGPEAQCSNVRHAVWERSYTRWGWEVDEVFAVACVDEDREDFHADC